MRVRRRSYGTVTVDVDVDIDDVLSELDDDALRDELRNRNARGGEDNDDLAEALHCLYRGDAKEAITILERVIYPKFPDAELARKRYAEAMGRPA